MIGHAMCRSAASGALRLARFLRAANGAPLLTCFLLATLAPGALVLVAPARGAEPAPSRVQQLQAEAKTLAPLVRTPLARDFLAAVPRLPSVQPRTVYRDSARTRVWTEREALALPDSVRAKLVSRVLDEKYYYDTRYGSPLAYVRALEILGQQGVNSVRGAKVADFGCGALGQLRLLAEMGAQTVGIDVDVLLPALYSEPGDQGAVGAGSVKLATGQWPATEAMRNEVGEGLDLFLSKNTLKNGYIHPAEKVDPRMLVHLGVDDSAYVAALARSVKPGGHVLIYNLCPAPAPPGKPYIPWADGRCPFPRELWERAGFRVVEFDEDDSPAARAMGQALGWDHGEAGMKLEQDLFATWSLFRRK
jgi:SAM-dependent methyltransferase